jgi:hypothetical protein
MSPGPSGNDLGRILDGFREYLRAAVDQPTDAIRGENGATARKDEAVLASCAPVSGHGGHGPSTA